MPHLKIRDTEIFYIDTGEVDSKQTIVFAHGLLWDHEMFMPQIEHLKKDYRCIAFDFRGQGQSPSTKAGYDMDNLTLDTLELIEQLVDGAVHFLGLSMGGFIGMRLAIRHPKKLKSLMLLETSADAEPEQNKPKYKKLCFVAKWFSIGGAVNKTMAIMFSQSFLNDPSKKALKTEWEQRMKKLNRWTFGRAVEGVIHRKGVYEELHTINTPTLILVGEEDVATVPAKAEKIQGAIKNSQLKRIPAAGHTSSIEQPELVNQHLTEFLQAV
ncbi:MAG: alpha/beta hydrolase [Enterobacterales bacterium]|nr:alpha/beta hydrolase [Enterobacterales bacterium]